MLWKILLADDEPWILKSLRYFLEHFPDKYEIVGEVRNGADAFKLIKTLNPHIVISDIRMPGMDGISLLEELHAMQLPTKVILLSGYSDFNYAKGAVRYNAADYLLKPLDRNELKCVLERITGELIQQNAVGKGNDSLAAETSSALTEQTLIEKFLEEIDSRYDTDLSLGSLAGKFGVNPSYLSNLISRSTGKPFTHHLQKRRLEKAKELLHSQELSVNEVADMVGYHDYFYFTKLFKKHEGISPSKYQKQQSNGESCHEKDTL